MIKQYGKEKNNDSRALNDIPLMCNVFSVSILNSPCTLVTCIALVLLTEYEVGKNCAIHQQNYVVNRSDFA